MTRRIKVIVFWVIIISCLFFLLRSIVGDKILKQNGKCKVAFLIDDISKIKSQKATLIYEFTIGNKKYKGNSLEEDLTKVGDSVCIVYLESFPSINKPLKYFDIGEIKCNCNK
ncbi:MAG TPA: hypothetical protein VGQ04_01740 [Chitinophagaceae bacterium]|jgi:hypothetical protein|nr:hypothetical protein [Chitinophagaceae bacterium]